MKSGTGSRQKHRVLRWATGLGLVVLILLVAAVGAFVAFGACFNLGPLTAARLTVSMHRNVTIGSLYVTPGRWLHIELKDLKVANVPGGSQPTMLSVTSVSGDVEAMSLIRHPFVIRGLKIEGMQVLLERTPDGQRSWTFGATSAVTPPPTNGRAAFPTLLDAEATGEVVFRTRSGANLDTKLDDLHLRTEAADQPVRLSGTGSYNGTPIALEADLASLIALRDAATPYVTDLHLSSGDVTLEFNGTMTDPLHLDGGNGRLELNAPTIQPLLRIAGAYGQVDASLRLTGLFEHSADLWHLTQATGALNKDTITTADLKLTEAQPPTPDDLSIDLAFDQLDANGLLGSKKAGAEDADVPLTVDRAPRTLIELKASARTLTYASVRATDVTFGGSLKPGRITVDVLSLGYLGAPFRLSGEIAAVPGPGGKDAGRVTASVDMTRMEVQTLRKLLGAGNIPIIGPMSGMVVVDAAGTTLNQAAHDARLSAVFAMDSGSISREVVEQASTDALALFRKASGLTPIECLVGIVDIRGGEGEVTPLRIRTADGTIVGRGTFNLYRRQLDITVASEARTTSVFALDVPMRISGSFASPTIRPAELSAAGRAELSEGDNVGRLLPPLQPFARRSPCLSTRPR